MASLPTTPNITAPTAGSPPTSPNPTITHTITSGEQQIARRIRITQSGNEVYNSGWEPTTSQSLVSPFAFANGTAYTLLLAIRNQYGLDSAEDSETFTPSYAGPAKPILRATAVNEGGYVLLDTSFSPTQINGCLLWFAADRITGLADGSAVASWADLSGNGNHATQATSGNKPIFKTNIVNGKPVVRFASASSKFLNLTTPFSNSALTFFAVIKATGFADASPILSGDTGAFEYRYSSTRVQELIKSFVLNIGASSTALSTSAFSLIDASYSSPNYAFRLNGAADGSGSNAQTPASPIKYLGNDNNAKYFDGDIAEIIVFDSALSTVNKQIVEAYLAAKYGISVPTAATAYIELWVYEPGFGRESAIRLTPHLPPDAIYSDHQRANGVAVKYFARAYSSTGLYTESDDSATITLTLSNLFLGAVSRTSVNSNSMIQPLALTNLPPQSLGLADLSVAHGLRGRPKPLVVFGQAAWRSLDVSVIARSALEKDNLMAVYALNTTVCVRDQFGNKIFGKMTKPQIVPEADFFRITFTVIQSRYDEAI